MFRLANQAKLRSFQLAPKYKYRFQVPHEYNHANILDEKNGNTKWQDSTSFEMKQLDISTKLGGGEMYASLS